MALRAAKCENCGGQIQVDDSVEKGRCPYCGTEYYAEKIINNTYITNNYDGATIISQGASVENYLNLAADFLKYGNIIEAEKYVNEALPLAPTDASIWNLKKTVLLQKRPEQSISFEDVAISFNNAIEYVSDGEELEVIFHESFTQLYELHISIISKMEMNKQKQDSMSKTEKDAIDHELSELGEADRACVSILLNDLLLNKRASVGLIDQFIQKDLSVKRDGILVATINSVMYFFKESILFSGPKTYPVSLNGESLQVMVKDKKGKGKEAAYVGSIILKAVQLLYSGYSSAQLNQLEQLMQEKDKGGCYVATSVYGSYNCPQVWVLRRFRDYHLKRKWYGRAFVRLYYTVSPCIVNLFGEAKCFRIPSKYVLDRVVERLKKNGYDDTQYDD